MIVLYEGKEARGYMAAYKCIPVSIQDWDTYVHTHFQMEEKSVEYCMFQNKKDGDCALYGVTLLSYQDEIALEKMKQSCSIQDLKEASLSVYDLHPLGIYIDDELAGICSVIQEGIFYDIGILVHPKYRKLKVATTLLNAMCEWISKQNGIAVYRVDEQNVASYQLAKKVGFEIGITKRIYKIKE